MGVFGKNYNVWDDWNNEDHPLEPLKPCPCCGGEAWFEDDGEMYPEIDSNGAYVGMNIYEGSLFWVTCQSCGLQSLAAKTPEEAIARWNKRVPVTVRYGFWKFVTFHNGCTPDYDCVCSECGESGIPDQKYCPHCGAQMCGELEGQA